MGSLSGSVPATVRPSPRSRPLCPVLASCPRRTGRRNVDSAGGAAGVPHQEREGGVHARSITIMGDPRKIDSGIEFVRDDRAAEDHRRWTAASGCPCSWTGPPVTASSPVPGSDEGAMRASDAGLHGAHARAAARSWAASPRVEEWEVGVMHRDHQAPAGSCCRVTWLQLEHGDIDRPADASTARRCCRASRRSTASAAPACWSTGSRAARAARWRSSRERGRATASREHVAVDPQRGAPSAAGAIGRSTSSSSSSAIAHLRLPELVVTATRRRDVQAGAEARTR